MLYEVTLKLLSYTFYLKWLKCLIFEHASKMAYNVQKTMELYISLLKQFSMRCRAVYKGYHKQILKLLSMLGAWELVTCFVANAIAR